MTEPKPFQKKTIAAALKALRDHAGTRRFLVADEVGLGKTVVAQHVILNMMNELRRRPLVVFYVCSSLSIAAQNRRKLLEVLPARERAKAECQIDRLTLLPAFDRPSHPRLNLYTLTPDTSIPERGGRRRDGRAPERALIHVLVEQTWPEFFSMYGMPANFFQCNAGNASWPGYIERERQRLARMKARDTRDISRLLTAFRDSVRRQLKLQPREWVCKRLCAIPQPLEIIANLRSALAACAIDQVHPDLVIFDEFQRFQDLLDEQIDEAASRVIEGLQGTGDADSHALMLLSATPYRLFSRRHEDDTEQSHHSEFFKLLGFLSGNGERGKRIRNECREAFTALELSIRRGELDSESAQCARKRIQSLLRPLMSRTERASHDHGWDNARTESLSADLHPSELGIFKQFANSLKDDHRPHAVPYWTSIPLPMQTMGGRYVVRKDAIPARSEGIQALNAQQRDRFELPAEPWAHPRLRSLLEHFPLERLALPWLPPSLPWWELDGQWRGHDRQGLGKVLVFSRFRAVPQAVASLISYTLESRLLGRSSRSRVSLQYQDVTKRRSLTATGERYPLLALFHPSPLICACTDPLVAASKSLEEVRESVSRQLRGALNNLGIAISSGDGPVRPVWRLLSALEERAGHWARIYPAWVLVHQESRRTGAEEVEIGRGMIPLLERWHQARLETDLVTLSELEVDRLVDFALSSPGVVVGRALRRHWPEALEGENYYHTLQVAWNGLRTYLDQRWFVMLLSGDEERTPYPDALQRAVLQGNLEAVLDEHLWITRKLSGLEGERLANELRSGLSLRTSPFKLHTPEADFRAESRDGSDDFNLRCHVAMPFTEARLVTIREDGSEEDHGLRTDELRRAFNTPFWPHILTTTSVGQEGLDFHVWCSQLVHWDLCGNPMDLEQREGRIQRFGGLAIRQAIARELGEDVLSEPVSGERASPWKMLERLADSRLADPSGLRPWWVCTDAAIRRYVFDVPGSEQRQRFAWMKEQRLLYRLALGQPNQEDLLEVLAGRADLTPEKLREVSVGLSAYFDEE